MSKIQIQKAPLSEIAGSCLRGEIAASYSTLVRVFGSPDLVFDGIVGIDNDKSDAEWIVRINGELATIYNWKDGPAYTGRRDISVEGITTWNVGGHSDVQHLVERAIESGVTIDA